MLTIELQGQDHQPPPPQTVRWVITFADLICLLLSFFVMLVSLSAISETRSKAAIYSLGRAFDVGPGGPAEPFTGSDGETLAAQQLQGRVGDVFAAVIPAAKVEVVAPGRLMQADFHADALFLEGKAQVRPGQTALFDRLVAAMQAPPPGQRLEMEVTIGTLPIEGGALPIGETPQSARVGAFAREMVARGLAPGALLVGITVGEPDRVRLTFRLSNQSEGQSDAARPH